MKRTSVKERRSHPRFATTVELEGVTEQGSVAARMIAGNLSLGGLYCTSSVDFREMTRLAVRLLLPARNGEAAEALPVDVEAVIVRREELPASAGDERFRFALFFTRVDAAARDRLRRYIEGLNGQPLGH